MIFIETTSTVTNTDLYSIQRERNPELKKNLRVKSIFWKVDDLFGVPSCLFGLPFCFDLFGVPSCLFGVPSCLFGVPSCFAVSGQSAYSKLPSYSTLQYCIGVFRGEKNLKKVCIDFEKYEKVRVKM